MPLAKYIYIYSFVKFNVCLTTPESTFFYYTIKKYTYYKPIPANNQSYTFINEQFRLYSLCFLRHHDDFAIDPFNKLFDI